MLSVVLSADTRKPSAVSVWPFIPRPDMLFTPSLIIRGTHEEQEAQYRKRQNSQSTCAEEDMT